MARMKASYVIEIILSSALGTYGKPCGMFQGVDKRDGCEEALGVTQSVAAISADLGGSSNNTKKNLEGRSGERFHENSSWS